MKFRILTGSGLALMISACLVFTAFPWTALVCAAAAFGVGCYLHRHRHEVDTDALHLGRIVVIAGAAVTFMAALVATGSPLKWIVLILSTLPILPAYQMGYLNLVAFYTIGYFFLIGILVASGPEKPPVSSGSTSRE